MTVWLILIIGAMAVAPRRMKEGQPMTTTETETAAWMTARELRRQSVIGMTYEAAIHCRMCAARRFGPAAADSRTVDREGNPLGAVFAWDPAQDPCDDCGELLD